MSFTIKTTQCNGTKVDVISFRTYADLLDDLEAIEQIPSIKIKYIKKDGQDLNKESCLLDVYVDEYRAGELTPFVEE